MTTVPAWMSFADQAALREVLLAKAPTSVLEVGAFAGSSTMLISNIPSVKFLLSVDVFDLRFISNRALAAIGLDRSFDVEDAFLSIKQEISQFRPDLHHVHVKYVFGSAVETDAAILSKKYDVIFLDADRSKGWLDAQLPNLLKSCKTLVGSHFNTTYAPELVEAVEQVSQKVTVIDKTNIWYIEA